MPRRVLIIVGHPDPSGERLCRALAAAYARGAERAGHAVRRIDLASLDFPLLRTMEQFEHEAVPDGLVEAVEAVVWAQHLVFVFPLWLGTMPALLKAFMEQVMRPGTAFAYPEQGKGLASALLRGRSARLVVTMGMPGPVYRLWFLDHGLAAMRRGILNFVGIRPVRETIFGMVGNASEARRARWIRRMEGLGESAA